MNALAHHQAGWYGKLPVLGDFAGQGLPSTFTDPWDAWLQRALVDSRRSFDAQFEELYLTFPIWRFLVPPGLAGPRGWCGVLSPSVDRVGRCFPLTLAQPLAAAQFADNPLGALDQHLERLAQLALQAVEGAAREGFEDAVAALPAAPHDTAAAEPIDFLRFGEPGTPASWRLRHTLSGWLPRAAERALLSRLGPRMLWWTPGADQQDGLLRLEPFPPADRLLTELIAAT